MVFSKEIDKSLYLILKNDRKNRKEIIDFIKGLPFDLKVIIQNDIQMYDNTYDVDFQNELSERYVSSDGSSYAYKYVGDIDELLVIKYGLNNDVTILSLSTHDRHIGKFYNVRAKNSKLKKKEYTYGISETKDKRIFYRINDVRDTSVPLIKELKEDKILKLNNKYI